MGGSALTLSFNYRIEPRPQNWPSEPGFAFLTDNGSRVKNNHSDDQKQDERTKRPVPVSFLVMIRTDEPSTESGLGDHVIAEIREPANTIDSKRPFGYINGRCREIIVIRDCHLPTRARANWQLQEEFLA